MAGDEITLKPTRRTFLKGMGVAAGAAAVWSPTATPGQQDEADSATPGLKELGRGERSITLTINGEARQVTVEPRTTLLEALRSKLGMTGSKEVCDRGSCGCCTVLFDGQAVMSCMVLAMDAPGHDIWTVEGIAASPKFKPLIDAFCEHDAAQCGFCIPGFVVRSAALLNEIPSPTGDQIRQGLGGNTCRCGTYSKIFDAVSTCAEKGGVS